ncbi:MAG: SGNH/GDSL hydrolase family protein, partial [Planctomycetaceae bacterium]
DAWKGDVPKFAADQLPRTIKKLNARMPIKLFLSGDSISEGYNATKFTKAEPGCPAYGELVARGLEKHYGCRVDFTNFAVAGWNASRGLGQVIEKNLGAEKPDLVIIAYGMNDVFAKDAEKYQSTVREIMSTFRAQSPETEFVLVATMLGNAEWGMPMEQFPLYRDALNELRGDGVVLADLTAVWREFLKHKSFYDLAGNGVNHPNDFGHRVYAQTILALLVPDNESSKR